MIESTEAVAELKRLNAVLAAQTRYLAIRAIEARDDERQRIAEALHDGLQQLLVACTLHLPTTGQTLDQSTWETLKSLLDASIQMCRSTICEITPPPTRGLTLRESLVWLKDWFLTNHKFDIQLDLPARFPPLSDDVTSLMIASVREALFNCVKHSGCACARLTALSEMDFVMVSISDDGQGFDPKVIHAIGDRSTGFGLFSTESRLLAVGGDFHIDASPGNGCVITIKMPIQAATAN